MEIYAGDHFKDIITDRYYVYLGNFSWLEFGHGYFVDRDFMKNSNLESCPHWEYYVSESEAKCTCTPEQLKGQTGVICDYCYTIGDCSTGRAMMYKLSNMKDSIKQKQIKKSCECGSEITYGTNGPHSSWCPKHEVD